MAGAPLAVPAKAVLSLSLCLCTAGLSQTWTRALTCISTQCPWCPCQEKGEERQPCALFHPRHKPTKREGTSLGLETIDPGKFGFPGIVVDFSSVSTTGLEDSRQSWCEKGGLRSSCPQGLLWSCIAWLSLWQSSSPGAPPWPSSWVILQLLCIPAVINGTPGAK